MTQYIKHNTLDTVIIERTRWIMYLFSVTVNRCLRLLYWMIENGGGGTKKSYEVTKVSKKKKIWRNEKTIKLKVANYQKEFDRRCSSNEDKVK